MTLLLLCVLSAVAMAAQDYCGTLCTIAESRGQGRKAGLYDAAGDGARLAGTAVSADAVITHGVLFALPVVAVVMLTSFLVTSAVTERAFRSSSPAHRG
jgi:hypothetical protein